MRSPARGRNGASGRPRPYRGRGLRRRRAEVVAPYRGGRNLNGGGGKPRPTGLPRIFQVWVGEVLGPPAGDCLSRQEVTLIRPPLGAPSPLEGEGWAGGHVGPPLRRETNRDHWLGKLRRKSGTAPRADFANAGPLWARKKPHSSTPNFARRKLSAPFRRASLVMGDRG